MYSAISKFRIPALALLLLCISCSSQTLTLIVEVGGNLSAATDFQLEVAAKLDGKSQKESELIVPGSMSRFALNVPYEVGRVSVLEIKIYQTTAIGCRVAAGTAVVQVSDHYAEGTVSVQMVAYATPQCPVTLVVSGSGSISTQDGRICTNTCVFEFPLGSAVSLTAVSGARSQPGTWEGVCGNSSAMSPCSFIADRSRRIELVLPSRTCSPDNLCLYGTPAGVTGITGLTAASSSGTAVVWAVGEGGTIIESRGGDFGRVTTNVPVDNFVSVSSISSGPETIYLLSNAGVYVRGSSGVPLYSCGQPIASPLRAVSASFGSQAYVVGDGGFIAVQSGIKCQPVVSPTTQNLNGVSYNGSSVLAVGDVGTIVRYDPVSGWVLNASATTNKLRAVALTGSQAAWAVGSAGTILRLTGSTWMPSYSGVTNDLYAVYARSANDVWAVGDAGMVLHFDGTSWLPLVLPSGSRANLRGVVARSSSDVWMIGTAGEAFRYAPSL